MGKEVDSFEEDFKTDYAGKSNSKLEQIKFALYFIWICIRHRPKIILSAHVNLSGLSHFVAKLIGAKSVLNVYGLELWSGLRKDAAWGLKNSDFVISDCHNTKDYLVNNNIRAEKDITVIWDCVDLDKFKPVFLGLKEIKEKYGIINNGKKIILTLGRISYSARHKGYHRLLEVFEGLNQNEFYLVLAGKGDLVNELKKIVQEKGISSNVCFTGMISEQDIPAIYSIPDVFSLVSEVGDGMGEGIPLTPLEAMACGKPIIVGNMDGSKEAVFDNINGIIIEPNDLVAHAMAIEKLCSQTTNHTQLREVAIKNFSFKEFFKKLEAFLIKNL
jgi:phosphatidylinositol alpha-1,6-mannosyltransferase